MPPNEELTFVNGFVVWQGHPVWWSGEAAGSPGPESRGPGIVNPRVTTQPPSFRRRRGISRFLHALGLI